MEVMYAIQAHEHC